MPNEVGRFRANRVRPNFDRLRTNINWFKAILGRTWTQVRGANLAESGPNLAGSGPNLGQAGPRALGFGQNRPNTGRHRPNIVCSFNGKQAKATSNKQQARPRSSRQRRPRTLAAERLCATPNQCCFSATPIASRPSRHQPQTRRAHAPKQPTVTEWHTSASR